MRNDFTHFVQKVFARRKLLPGKFWVFAPLEGGGLLVHRVDPGPGSMCSSPEKPSRTRAGGRGGRRGNLALRGEKEKTKS